METVQPESLTLDDVARLLGLIVSVADEAGCSFSRAIELICERSRLSPDGHTDRIALADFMARTRQVRMKRNTVFGAPLFRDPGFDMLLELYAADQGGQEISVTSLCYASGVPFTTALRHLDQLERHGLVVREGDRQDSRRSYVRPTAKTITALEILFNQWLAAWVQLMNRSTKGLEAFRAPQGDSNA